MFRMPIIDVFRITGRGPVVAGPLAGICKVGMEVTLLEAPEQRFRVTGAEMFSPLQENRGLMLDTGSFTDLEFLKGKTMQAVEMPFRYFLNPHAWSAYKEEPRACSLCGQSGPGYEGWIFAGESDVECVCEACLAAGRLPEHGLSCNTGDVAALRSHLTDEALVTSRTRAVEQQTPAPVTWQDFLWPAHCGEYCYHVKEAGRADIMLLAGRGDPVEYLRTHLDDRGLHTDVPALWSSMRADSPQCHSETDSDVGVYLFRCFHCHEYVFLWDSH